MAIEVFRRKEIKYVLSPEQYETLMKKLKGHVEKDQYYKSTICNIYYDTDNYDLIVHSIDKPVYKEKVRLRSYEVPKLDDYVFLEIKKKRFGIVGKRRIKIKLKNFYDYIKTGKCNNCNKQIQKEIDYCFKMYDLKPKLFLAYDRLSYYDKDNPSFRITFDHNIRSRQTDLKLEKGDKGTKLFKDNKIIMETKALNAYPLWFVKILSEMKLYPQSFSKYGTIYKEQIKEEKVYV